MARHVQREAVQAAQGSQLAAVQDLLAQGDLSAQQRAAALRALIEGASRDDREALRQALLAGPSPEHGTVSKGHPDDELANGWRDGGYPYRHLMRRSTYEAQKYQLQVELLKLQAWVKETGQRVVILFEGRDAAGKGGAIKRFMEHLNPRGARVVALEKPSEVERGQWYFQRYVQHLPTAGEIVLFDRSWYNRAGVEKVMGFASEAQVAAFLRDAPVFERQLVDDGILLFKYWLGCDQAVQEARFAERLEDPLKGWKLSPIDLQARERYRAYTDAREAMLEATHTAHAPWTVVDFNDQKRGRLTLLRDLLDRLPDTAIDAPALELAPLANKPAKERYRVLKPIRPFKA